jgi:hypothetical protein
LARDTPRLAALGEELHALVEVPRTLVGFGVEIRVGPLDAMGMTDTMNEPISTRNLDRYGSAELPWSRPRDILASDTPGEDLSVFVATVRPDGRPHSAGVGAIWLDDALFFTTGPGTLKSRNLAANPACSVSVRLRGIDLVLAGEARRITDASTLDRVASVYRTGGWPASVDGAEPHGATRWDFAH